MRTVTFLIVCVLVVSAGGCQMSASGHVNGSLFYPKKVGDPREAMFAGSGYVERHSAGSQSDFKGFGKLEGGELK